MREKKKKEHEIEIVIVGNEYKRELGGSTRENARDRKKKSLRSSERLRVKKSKKEEYRESKKSSERGRERERERDRFGVGWKNAEDRVRKRQSFF